MSNFINVIIYQTIGYQLYNLIINIESQISMNKFINYTKMCFRIRIYILHNEAV